ncbi:uncharacterized protein L3040_009491 [Drepanopeziza brunnea f. sp. 'multigermtubi']|uniref:Uncharacterized protein n=1 Tax=Marssonina brunnea f. sp. multigermtubi (strain MB_m1) TaxID=1072389 RepID=K1WT87_MARBU|nr:uncharacterized protein MBM_05570 [Drepanopeziza brunnea f. sp. 'multigermtubi' MB_m1]EKD16276.1 hypothetical protein MBM_05570 [Drepanopeziza brunnea f. sp. 'multigermtubi' MB_m1]KAJ5032900.1 hypothetical protein L3040_009491 [Drepanopeziza brunnea f. sp. 'multigermtubi']
MQTPATAPILPPRTEEVLTPLLASLPAASISPSPPTALLPKLSPILRQRVQILSSTGQEPWLPLLCYDAANAPKLEQVVKNEAFEPHPVSGEVELDWDNVQARYKRVDEETLQCTISLFEIQLSVRLIWCVNDEMGGGDGWRIGEVNVLDTDTATASEEIWGQSSIPDAERAFETSKAQGNPNSFKRTNGTNSVLTPEAEKEEEDDDDDYWAQYDNTPARTPGPQRRSPAPQNMSMDVDGVAKTHSAEDEASYYAQYSSVQPAMDNHDPDEAQQNGDIESSLGKDEVTHELQQHLTPQPHLHSELHSTAAAWSEDNLTVYQDAQRAEGLAQPRPGSSAGSSGSDTVARLEQRAAASAVREQSEVGIKQHIGTSVKSLYRLAKVAGIDRREFERVIRTELDCLGLMDEGDD